MSDKTVAPVFETAINPKSYLQSNKLKANDIIVIDSNDDSDIDIIGTQLQQKQSQEQQDQPQFQQQDEDELERQHDQFNIDFENERQLNLDLAQSDDEFENQNENENIVVQQIELKNDDSSDNSSANSSDNKKPINKLIEINHENHQVIQLSSDYVYEFQKWEQTELKNLLKIDRQKHFSNERIDAYIANINKFNIKRQEMIDANPDTPLDQLTITWTNKDYIYPKDISHNCNVRKSFRNYFEKHNLKIDLENNILFLETGEYFANNPVSKFTGRIILRPQYLEQLFIETHTNVGHVEYNAVARNIRQKYAIWKMKPWIMRRIELCGCKELKKKRNNKKYPVGKSDLTCAPLPLEPTQVWHIDLSVGYPESFQGNKYLLHCVDAYSRFVVLCPIPDKDPTTVCHAIKRDVFRYFGFPSTIYSDNGGEFSNPDLVAMAEYLNCEVLNTRSHRPQGNSYAELSVKKWKNFFKTLLITSANFTYSDLSLMKNYPKDWDQWTYIGMLKMNQNCNQATNEMPIHTMINSGNKLKYHLLNLRKSKDLAQIRNENLISENKNNIENDRLLLQSDRVLESSQCLPLLNEEERKQQQQQQVIQNSQQQSQQQEQPQQQPQQQQEQLPPSLQQKQLLQKDKDAVINELLELGDAMLYQPPPEQKQFAFGTENCFGLNANDPKSNKTIALYSNKTERVMRDNFLATQCWTKKLMYKRSWDKTNVSWQVGTKVIYRSGKKWLPTLSLLFFHNIVFYWSV